MTDLKDSNLDDATSISSFDLVELLLSSTVEPHEKSKNLVIFNPIRSRAALTPDPCHPPEPTISATLMPFRKEVTILIVDFPCPTELRAILDNDWGSTGFIPFLLALGGGMKTLGLVSDTSNSWVG